MAELSSQRFQELDNIFSGQEGATPLPIAPPTELPPERLQAFEQAIAEPQQDLGILDRFLVETATAPASSPIIGALQTAKKEIVSPIEEALVESKFDIGGGIGGGLAGGRIGSFLGPVGTVVGGVAGGILGATGGKELDQAFNEKLEEKSFNQNLLQSTLEEATGRGVLVALGIVKPVVSAVIDPVVEQGKKLASKLGILDIPTKSIDDLFITSKEIDPLDLSPSPRTIIQAQENILNSRLLTTFEETGGRAGVGKQIDLETKVIDAQEILRTDSAFIKNRNIINDKIKTAIAPKSSVGLVDETVSTGVKDSFQDTLQSFKPKFKAIEDKLIPLERRAKINILGMDVAIANTAQLMQRKIGTDGTSKILNTITETINAAKKNTLTLQDFKILDADIEKIIGDFSPSKDVQSKIAGAYAAIIKPIISDFKERALATASVDSPLAKATILQKEFASIAKQRGEIINSKVGRALGLTEQRQTLKGTTTKRLQNVIFESKQSWEETVDILNISNPDLIITLENNFKGRILKDSFDPVTKEIDVRKLTAQIDKFGEDLIFDIGGESYLRVLRDVQLIGTALQTTKSLLKGVPTTQQGQVGQALRRTFLLPLARKIGIFQLITSSKKAFGLGRVTDEQLFKSMQGERGQLLIERASNTFLNNPNAYNSYVQVAREFMKINDKVQIVSESDFQLQAGDILARVNSIIGNEQKEKR